MNEDFLLSALEDTNLDLGHFTGTIFLLSAWRILIWTWDILQVQYFLRSAMQDTNLDLGHFTGELCLVPALGIILWGFLHVNIIFLSSDQIDTDMDHFAGLIFLQPWVLNFIPGKI